MDYVICEMCGKSFYTRKSIEVCNDCCGSNTTKQRAKISGKAQAARDNASLFGGKALTGTLKQKEWAEQIRFEKLSAMPLYEAQKLCGASAVLNSASFWINNRNKKFTFGDAVETIIQLRALNEKYSDTLSRTGKVSDKDFARKEIFNFYKTCNVILDGEFPTLPLQTILSSI